MIDGPSLRILVTGAAGLIGSELCGCLAEQGHAVIALVHHNRRLVRNDGTVIDPPCYSGLGPDPGTVVSITGDVREAGLGLRPKEASALAGDINLIVHCAAETGFAASFSQHRTANVNGTANILAFAHGAQRGSPPGLVHLSTAYVCGERSGPIREDELDVGQTFANGYEASKAEAEALTASSGLRVAVARPSIVVGSSESGRIGRFENIYALLRLIGESRIHVLPVAPGATLDLVPIDHVIGGLLDIIKHFEAAAGRTLHLVSGDPIPVSALVTHDYPGFHVPRIVAPGDFDSTSLDPAESWLYRSVTSHFASYLQRDPRFSAQNLRELSGRGCPPTGAGFLRRIVDYAASAGYMNPDPDLVRRSASLT